MLEEVITDGVIHIGTQIEVAPGQTDVDTSRQIGMRITNDGTVIYVDFAIAIHIFQLVATYPSGGIEIVLRGDTIRQYAISLHVLLALVDTIHHVAIEHTDRLPYGGDVHLTQTGRIEQIGRTQTRHLIHIARDVGRDVVAELTHLVTPTDGEVDTTVLHVTDVDTRLGGITGQGGPVGRHQQVGSLLDIEVETGGQAVVESGQVEANVEHLRGLPLRVGIT